MKKNFYQIFNPLLLHVFFEVVHFTLFFYHHRAPEIRVKVSTTQWKILTNLVFGKSQSSIGREICCSKISSQKQSLELCEFDPELALIFRLVSSF